MKILVLSDSHGWRTKLEKIIFDNKDADVIVFLGDGLSDFEDMSYIFESFRGKRVVTVRGNCDRNSLEPITALEDFGGFKFYITHGFDEMVKSGLGTMWQEMVRRERNVGLYGHTHHQDLQKLEDKYFFNPGAVANGDYGLIFIDEEKGEIDFRECNVDEA